MTKKYVKEENKNLVRHLPDGCYCYHTPPEAKFFQRKSFSLAGPTIMHQHRIRNDYRFLLLHVSLLLSRLFLQCKQDNYRRLMQEIRCIMSL